MTTPQRLLIIDSDNVRRAMLACSLPSTQFTLEFAKTPDQGLSQLRLIEPNLVLVGLDPQAKDLCQHIRLLPAGQKVRIILLANAADFKPEQKDNCEADIALPFPFSLDELNTCLDKLGLDQKDQSAPLELDLNLNAANDESDDPPIIEDDGEALAWETFRRRVIGLHKKLDQIDYYELLGVEKQASVATIKDAYFACSIDYHPDRFMQLEDEKLRQQIYELFKRMTEAFKILLDPKTRDQYNAQIDSQDTQHAGLRFIEIGPSDQAQGQSSIKSAAARKYLNFADEAEKNGNLKSARMYLTLASQSEPQNVQLRSRLEALAQDIQKHDTP